MSAFKHLLASAVFAAVVPAVAAPIFIDFETSPLAPELAGNSYSSLGIVFTGDAYTIHSNASLAGTGFAGGNFERFGSSSTAALGIFSAAGATSSDFFINVAAGFSGMFSMLYTSTTAASGVDFVELFTGENGSGSLVNAGSRPDPNAPGKTLPGESLLNQGTCVNPLGVPLPSLACNWSQISLDFTGTAKSVHVSGATGVYFFDNLTFGSTATTPPGGKVPEPGGIALSLAALGALACTRKRYQR